MIYSDLGFRFRSFSSVLCSCSLYSVFDFRFVFRFCITNESDDGFEDEIESYVTVTQSRSCGSKVLDSI